MTNNNMQSHILNVPFEAYEGDEPYIFICYDYNDAEHVFPDLEKFKNEGYNIWHNRNGWRRGIIKNLSKSSLCVVFLSENSANSESVLTEIIIANEKEIPIVPIYIEPVELKDEIRYELMLIPVIFKFETTENEYDSLWKKAFKEHISNTIGFGIDLGTTNSCIAKFEGNDTIVVPNKKDNKNHIASAVYIKKNGTILVGDKARNKIMTNPKNGYAEFKLRMGSDYVYEFEASGRQMTSIELSAEILKNLTENVKQRYQKNLKSAAITVPADFPTLMNQATVEAAKLAGLNDVILMQEPVAAAMAYGFGDSHDNETWMIYDFGESTFDISILKNYSGKIKNINNQGDAYLGGKLIDWDIVDKVFVPAVIDEFGLSDFNRNNPNYIKLFAKLKRAAENAKIDLSKYDTAEVEIENFIITEDGDVFDFEYNMTRADLEKVMEPYFDRTINHCKKALDDIGLSVGDINKIVLVGGSTLSPYIHERLTEEFNIPLEYSIDPTTVVARGAAIFAGNKKISKNNDSTEIPIEKEKNKYDVHESTPANELIIDKSTPTEKIRNFKKEIVLDSNIVLSDGEESQYREGIRLDTDDLIIDGNGFTVDARGKTRIFYCTAKNITIKNITLKNGFATALGGAIYNSDGELTITGSTLTGNTTEGTGKNEGGGVIYNIEGSLTIIETRLNNNTSHYGGAIYNNSGELTITESTLAENTADYGGAIFDDIKGELTITESTLTENTADYGGAIGNRGKLTITESTLAENTSEEYGGAISNWRDGTITITDTKFIKNTSAQSIIENGGTITITGSTLTQNTAERMIYNYSATSFIGESKSVGKMSIYNTIITQNSIEIIISNSGIIQIVKTMITQNSAENGKILDNYGEMNIYKSEINDNISRDYIIDNKNTESSKIYIENTIIKNNHANYNIIRNESILTFKFSVIGNNKCGEFIFLNNGNKARIIKTAFKNNISYNNSINICNNTDLTIVTPIIEKDSIKSILNKGNLTIPPKSLEKTIINQGKITHPKIFDEVNNNFAKLNNLIKKANKEIILEEDYILYEYEKDFFEGGIELNSDDLVIDGQNHIINGNMLSRIFIVTGKNITLKNIIFKNGKCFKSLYESGNNNGGAILNRSCSVLTIENCKFINNNSQNNGGVLYNEGELTMRNTTLQENSASNFGGAISNESYLFISKCVFIKNTSEKHGGAIHNKRGNVLIKNTDLNQNNSEWGGAIYNYFNSKMTIVKSTLKKNIATLYGGAIFNYKGTITIQGTVLQKNTSQSNGGAIYNDSKGVLTITESTLTENTSEEHGGAIDNNGELTITKSTLNENTSKNNGGVIYNYVGELTITESTLNNNTANRDGGAINNNREKSFNIKNCKLENNKPNDYIR